MLAVVAVVAQYLHKIEVLVVAVSAVTELNHMLVVKPLAQLVILAAVAVADITAVEKILLVVLQV
jgi:hypothetical protein